MEHLARLHRIKHHLTFSYSPLSNVSEEALLRSILSATLQMLAELKLTPLEWPSVLPAIYSASNKGGLYRLGHRQDIVARIPLACMIGIRPVLPLLQIPSTGLTTLTTKSISHARAQSMHNEVSSSTKFRCDRSIEARNEATNIFNPSFPVRNFSVVRRANWRGHKIKFLWFDPRRISSVYSPLVYGITSLCRGKSEKVHCTPLLKYNDHFLWTTILNAVLGLTASTESRNKEAERITKDDEDENGVFRVHWKGLPDKRDWT